MRETKGSVAFHTLGCKLNFSETSTISRDFVQHGFEKVGFKERETHTQLTRLVEELTLRLLEMEERIVELESQLAQE